MRVKAESQYQGQISSVTEASVSISQSREEGRDTFRKLKIKL